MSDKLPIDEIYPKYFQSTDGSEQIKILSRRSYVYLSYWVEGDFYTVRADHKENSEYREANIRFSYKKSDEEEYKALLSKVTAYFIRVEQTFKNHS